MWEAFFFYSSTGSVSSVSDAGSSVGKSVVEVQEGEGKVLVFDDVLATGGTAKGSIEVLKKAGYTPTSALFLVELDFLKPKLDVLHRSIIHYE